MRAIQKSAWALVAFATALAGCATPYDPATDPDRPAAPTLRFDFSKAAQFHAALADAQLADDCAWHWLIAVRGTKKLTLPPERLASIEASLHARGAVAGCIAWMESDFERQRHDHAQVLAAYDANRVSAEKENRSDLTAGALGVLGVAAVVALAVVAAKRGAFSDGSSSRSSLSSLDADFSWAWDEFYDDKWNLVWNCRGVQTGQFAPEHKCAGKEKTDSKWPGKSAP